MKIQGCGEAGQHGSHVWQPGGHGSNRVLCEGGGGWATAFDAAADWTVDRRSGRHSPEFLRLCDEVERLIRGDAHNLIAGRADETAGLIVAQLAHKHGLVPRVTESA